MTFVVDCFKSCCGTRDKFRDTSLIYPKCIKTKYLHVNKKNSLFSKSKRNLSNFDGPEENVEKVFTYINTCNKCKENPLLINNCCDSKTFIISDCMYYEIL